ncbi:MAG: hypothetical protein J7647_23920 [Cyanobacteria bacterium SBLK]|nr:hypothetical protein [Cyanobacteria bacterium SBLK]
MRSYLPSYTKQFFNSIEQAESANLPANLQIFPSGYSAKIPLTVLRLPLVASWHYASWHYASWQRAGSSLGRTSDR